MPTANDNESNFLRDLSIYSDKLVEYIEEIESSLEYINVNEYRKMGFIAALSKINEVAVDLVIIRAVEAAIQTEEYDYPPYLNHLTTAINLNRDDIITITPTESFSDIIVKVNFHALGGIEEWAAAVQKVKDGLQLGKTGKAAAKIWKEKIYRVDREGGKVLKYYKGRGVDRKTTQVDITERYKGKYEETINYRLRMLDPKKAPFWYLIEHGNAGSGKAYPEFAGTGFIQLTEAEIRGRFNQIKEQYESIIYRRILSRNYELNRRHEEVSKRIEEEMRESVESGKFNVQEVQEKTKKLKWTRETVEQVTERIRVETYLVGSKTRTLVRDIITGEFASLTGITR